MIVERSISLSAGEWRIMERLWDRHPQTLTELVRVLGADIGWSKSTIVTMVGRLEAKGAVTRTEGGRARLYALADGRGLTDRDIEELSAVLEKARRERK